MPRNAGSNENKKKNREKNRMIASVYAKSTHLDYIVKTRSSTIKELDFASRTGGTDDAV